MRRNYRRPKHCWMVDCGIELKNQRKLIRLCPSCRYSMGAGAAIVGALIGVVKWIIAH